MQEARGDGQKPHSQGPGMRGELAHDSEAHRYAAYGKCGACAPTVRVLTWGDLHRVRCVLMMTDPERVNDFAAPDDFNLVCGAVVCSDWLSPLVVG